MNPTVYEIILIASVFSLFFIEQEGKGYNGKRCHAKGKKRPATTT